MPTVTTTFSAVLCSVDRKAFAPVSRNWIREVNVSKYMARAGYASTVIELGSRYDLTRN